AGPPDRAAHQRGDGQRPCDWLVARLDPLHGLRALRFRHTEGVKIRQLPWLNPGRCTDRTLDEPRARGAESAVAVEEERAAHTCSLAREPPRPTAQLRRTG